MKRSPRDGWSLIELRDGLWRVVTTGDREQLRGVFAARVSTIYETKTPEGGRYSQRHNGQAVALYDAVGQRRDECPFLPRLTDGTLIMWPTGLPSDGEEPTARPQREPAQ